MELGARKVAPEGIVPPPPKLSEKRPRSCSFRGILWRFHYLVTTKLLAIGN